LLSERAVERGIKRVAVRAIERVADEGVSEQLIVSISDLVTLPNNTPGSNAGLHVYGIPFPCDKITIAQRFEAVICFRLRWSSWSSWSNRGGHSRSSRNSDGGWNTSCGWWNKRRWKRGQVSDNIRLRVPKGLRVAQLSYWFLLGGCLLCLYDRVSL
jgi:hypothetical protein